VLPRFLSKIEATVLADMKRTIVGLGDLVNQYPCRLLYRTPVPSLHQVLSSSISLEGFRRPSLPPRPRALSVTPCLVFCILDRGTAKISIIYACKHTDQLIIESGMARLLERTAWVRSSSVRQVKPKSPIVQGSSDGHLHFCDECDREPA
jgi:hypothetical protein